MSIRLGNTTIPFGFGQTSYIQQPADATTLTVNIGGVVRSTTGLFYFNVSGTSQSLTSSTVFTDTNTWSEVGAGGSELRVVEESVNPTPVAYDDVILIGGSGVDLTVGTQTIGEQSYGNVVNIQFDPSEAGVAVNSVDGSTTTELTGHLRVLENAYGIQLLEPVENSNRVTVGVTPNLFAKEQDFLNINTHSLTDWPVAGTITRTGSALFTDAQLGVGQPDDANVVNRTAYHEHNRELLVDIDDGTAIPNRGQLIAKYSAATGGTLQWYGKVTATNDTTRIFWVQIIQGHDYLEEEGNSQEQIDGSLDFNGSQANRLYLLQHLFVATVDDEIGMLSLDEHHNLIVRPLSDSATPATGNAARFPNEGRVNELIAADNTVVRTNAIPQILTSDIAEATIPITITTTTTVDVGLGADYASISQQLAQRQPLTLYKRDSGTGNEHRVFIRFTQLDAANQAITCTIDSREGDFASEQTGPWSLFPSWAGTGTGGGGGTFDGRIRVNASAFSRNLAAIDVGESGMLTLTADGLNALRSLGSISGLTLDVSTTENTVLYQFKMKVTGFSTMDSTVTGDITYINQALRATSLTDNPSSWIVTFGGIAQDNVGNTHTDLIAYTDILGRDPDTLNDGDTFRLSVDRFVTTTDNTQFRLDINGQDGIQTYTIENGHSELTFPISGGNITAWDSVAAINDVRLTPVASDSTLSSIVVQDINSVLGSDTDTTIAIQDNGVAEAGVTTLNFDNSLNVSTPVNGVAIVSVNENAATNVLSNAPRTAGELLGLTSYSGTYTLREAAATAPTINYYGQQANTVPTSLPTTVGTHPFTFSWPVITIEDIQANRGDSVTVYGDSPDNLNITVDGDRTFFRDVTSVVGLVLTDIQQMDNGVTRATRTNFDGTSDSVDLAGEVVVRSQHNTEWTSTTPPDSLGANGSLAVDDTGSGISALYVKVADTWSSLSFQPTTGVGANLSAGRSGTTVTLRTTTNGDTLVIEGAGAGTLQINDIANQDNLDTAVPLGTMTKALWDGGQFVASVTSTDGTSTSLIHKRLITGNNTTVRNYYGEFTSTALIVYANQDRSTTLLTQNYVG